MKGVRRNVQAVAWAIGISLVGDYVLPSDKLSIFRVRFLFAESASLNESRHIKVIQKIQLELLAYSKFSISHKLLSLTLPPKFLRRGIFRARVFTFYGIRSLFWNSAQPRQTVRFEFDAVTFEFHTARRSLKELSNSIIVFLRKIIWNFLQFCCSGKILNCSRGEPVVKQSSFCVVRFCNEMLCCSIKLKCLCRCNLC